VIVEQTWPHIGEAQLKAHIGHGDLRLGRQARQLGDIDVLLIVLYGAFLLR